MKPSIILVEKQKLGRAGKTRAWPSMRSQVEHQAATVRGAAIRAEKARSKRAREVSLINLVGKV